MDTGPQKALTGPRVGHNWSKQSTQVYFEHGLVVQSVHVGVMFLNSLEFLLRTLKQGGGFKKSLRCWHPKTQFIATEASHLR